MQKDKQKLRSDYVNIKNWYTDRYNVSLLQRNFLFVFCIGSVIAVIVSLIMIKTIIEKNSIEPYIIKVEDPNDVPVAVSVQDISAYVASNKLVLEHFLSKYIKARESYDPDSYKYDYGSVVAAMSSPEVYAAFKGVYLNDKDLSPIKKIGQFGRIEVNIQQVVARENANAFIFRIAKNIYSYNNLTDTQFYQITVNYRFDTSNMSYAASMVNPLGIKVFKYEVLSEKNINNS